MEENMNAEVQETKKLTRKEKREKKKAERKALPLGKRILLEIRDWAVSIVVAVLAVYILRTYICMPITVSGGSMNSTLLDKERLFVTAYDVSIVNHLTRGDVVICHYPGRTSPHPIAKFITVQTDFVKRLVGMPGDKVSRVQGVTYINDKALDPSKGAYGSYPTYSVNEDGAISVFVNGSEIPSHTDEDGVLRYSVGYGREYTIEEMSQRYSFDYEYVLGEDEYFCVGDNRYSSHDSRAWNGPDLPFYDVNDPTGHVGPVKKGLIEGRVRYVFWPAGENSARAIETNPDYIDPRDVN